MGVIEPLGLVLALLAIPIIVFYMLRLRRHEIVVSSSMLWRQVLQDRQANSPWQRLRRNLLLYLQLLVLALLVLALARPFVVGADRPAGNLVVILDGAAGMQARDGGDGELGETRFARAQAEAASLVDRMAPGARMTIILAGPTPATVISQGTDPAALRTAIAALRPSNAPSDIAAAVTLAAAAAQAPGTTLYVISDGTLGDQKLPEITATVRYIPIGHSAENSAITALALRDAPQGPQLFVGLADLGTRPVSGLLDVEVDGRLWDSRPISMAAGSDVELTLPDLPLTTRLVTATLKVPDILALDSTAWAVRAAPAIVPTLLVSAGNSFMEKALGLLPQVQLARAQPADYKPGPGFALTVFDGYLPATLPPGNLLIVDPPGGALLPISGTIAGPVIGAVEVNDPMLRYVDLSNVHVAEARRVLAPPWARALVRTTAGDPLILAGETEGRRIAVLAFDLHRSDLALQVAFPILVANLVGWLAPGSAVEVPPRLTAGAALAINPLPDADQVTITAPAGPDLPVRRTTLAAGSGLSFADTGQLGLYQVQQSANGRPLGPPEWFAVNLLDRAESDLAPRASLDLRGSPVTGGAPAGGTREVGPLLLALGTLLLLLEWWIYHHGSSGLLRRLLPRPR